MRRGRPSKFGRPSQAVVMTLPVDVVEWLRSINPDTARAVVTLYERAQPGEVPASPTPTPPGELVQLPRRRALIVVDPRVVCDLEGVALIPLADGRAFLALEPGRGLADLEVAVIDRLDSLGPADPSYAELRTFRDMLREWRTSSHLRFQVRSILVAERRPGTGPSRALGVLDAIDDDALDRASSP